MRLCCANVTESEDRSRFVIELYSEKAALRVIKYCHYKVLKWADGSYYVPGFEKDEIWEMQEFARCEPKKNDDKSDDGKKANANGHEPIMDTTKAKEQTQE